MKRFIIACCVFFALAGGFIFAYSTGAVHPTADPSAPIEHMVRQEGKQIQIARDGRWEDFEIRGVDLGAGIPGHFATDYAIDKDTYLRWFDQMKAMGANVVRVYILQSPAFYDALLEYNQNNPDPLYVLHGVWVNDYVQNSHADAFDEEFIERFKEDIATVIDVIHGRRVVELGRGSASGTYESDVSQWVLGYLLGVEWEGRTVAYTDMEQAERASYQGDYIKTSPDATAFEAMLAEVGDWAFRYETDRYREQRLVAFSNWPTTDPIEYPEALRTFFEKVAEVDVEHLDFTENVRTGTFASYHIYPYYPDYLRYLSEYYLQRDPQGNVNTYYTYLRTINEHHSVPVVISEFGVPTSRGKAQRDANTGRDQGGMSELDQGYAIASCYRDIRDAGCAGSCIFTWQDEWFKRTWNTMESVDLQKTPFWSDYQTNEQYFGLLSFDPGDERCVSYVDGDAEEWGEEDVLGASEGRSISMKYDEKFVYLMVRGADVGPEVPLYLAIDTTQKSGSRTCAAPDLAFDRAADFVVALTGPADSRVLVQERSCTLRATSLLETAGIDPFVDPPAKDTDAFVPVEMLLQTLSDYSGLEADIAGEGVSGEDGGTVYQTFETGKLVCGNANPVSPEFNSLADFCYGSDEAGGFVEVKLPWQLLNFANPSEMNIHDDYYDNYGVEYQSIDRMYVGAGDGARPIELKEAELRGWGGNVTYHERLKPSYYLVQRMWTAPDALAEARLIAAEGDAR